MRQKIIKELWAKMTHFKCIKSIINKIIKGVFMKSKGIRNCYRHGDILVIEMNRIPKEARPLNHLVLAEGEATGHAHIVNGEATLYERNGILYLKVHNNDAYLRHEEHKAINLPIGNYKIKKQREYQPKEPKKWRETVD